MTPEKRYAAPKAGRTEYNSLVRDTGPRNVKESSSIMRNVSTWSLHRTLGRFAAPDSAYLGGPFMPVPPESAGLTLLDLPAELKRHGYDAVQICHFHLPERSPGYLRQLSGALDTAGIALEMLLIDDGDPTDDRSEPWLNEWLNVAAALGAKRARIMAGRAAPTPELIRTAAQRLVRLADAHPEVRIVTENWLGMMPDAQAVRSFLAETGDVVGLLIDLGNWRGPGKYDELAAIAPLAESCHAKCHVADGELGAEDFRRSLRVLKDAGYAGPLALIYDGPDADEWTWLGREQALVDEVFGHP
jgi:sugar phosphate isomerase/epimerase